MQEELQRVKDQLGDKSLDLTDANERNDKLTKDIEKLEEGIRSKK